MRGLAGGYDGWCAQLSGQRSRWLTADFNTQPDEATYQLLTNPHSSLPSLIAKDVVNSRFVHKSLDAHYALNPDSTLESAAPSNSGTGTATPVAEAEEKEDAEGEGEGELPDTDERSVAGTRSPIPADGIPELDTLVELATKLLPDQGLQSAYTAEKWAQGGEATFARRDGFARSFEGSAVPSGLTGQNEPAYTCYTPLFKLTLGGSSTLTRCESMLTSRLPAPPPLALNTSDAAPPAGHRRAAGRGVAKEGHLRERSYRCRLRDRVVSA
jgi:RNA exonuclease NGL2